LSPEHTGLHCLQRFLREAPKRELYGEIETGWIRLDAPMFTLQVIIQFTSRAGPGGGGFFKIGGLQNETVLVRVIFHLKNEGTEVISALVLMCVEPQSRTPQISRAESRIFHGLIIRSTCIRNLSQTFEKISQVYQRVDRFSLYRARKTEYEAGHGSYTYLITLDSAYMSHGIR
jgi:hypothetical protein